MFEPNKFGGVGKKKQLICRAEPNPTQTVSLIPTPCLYTKVRTSLRPYVPCYSFA